MSLLSHIRVTCNNVLLRELGGYGQMRSRRLKQRTQFHMHVGDPFSVISHTSLKPRRNTEKKSVYPIPVPPPFSKNVGKNAGTNEFAFFRCRSIRTRGFRIIPKKIRKMPSGRYRYQNQLFQRNTHCFEVVKGGSLQGGASFKVEKADFAVWNKGLENHNNEVKLPPPSVPAPEALYGVVLVVRVARPTSLTIWHRCGRLHRRSSPSDSPNRRDITSLDIKIFYCSRSAEENLWIFLQIVHENLAVNSAVDFMMNFSSSFDSFHEG